MISRLSITALFVYLLSSATGMASDFAYVSNDELNAEWERRKADVVRTRSRIRHLQEEHELAAIELIDAKEQLADAEEMVKTRAQMFYRISKRGAAIKYLLGLDTPLEVLKRFNQIRHLLEDGIDQRRRATMRFETAKVISKKIQSETEMALKFLTMLEQALSEIRSERLMRKGK